MDAFNPLLSPLDVYNNTTIGFKLAETTAAPVYVVGRVKSTARVSQVDWAMNSQKNFSEWYWLDVFNQALLELPSCRTRHYNQPGTAAASRTVPAYYRVFQEDLSLLSQALSEQSLSGTPFGCLEVLYGCWKFGQQHRAPADLSMDPAHFKFDLVFEEELLDLVSVHVAINIFPRSDSRSSLWLTDNLRAWLPPTSKLSYVHK